MRVPDSIRECVVYVCSKKQHKGNEIVYKHGTAFFMGLGITPTTRLMYLVTAKHLIDDARAVGNVHVRVNTKAGGFAVIELDFDDWKPHDDPGVDIAVLRFCDDTPDLSYMYVDSSSSIDKRGIENWRIGIGSETLIAGLFTARSELQRNLPIVRSGMISAMPEEPFLDPENGLEFDGYLVETRSTGGLSGSPVFVVMPYTEVIVGHYSGGGKRYFVGPHEPQHTSISLLGVVRSYYFVKDSRGVSPYTDKEFEKINMGITVVVPITKVLEILRGTHFVKEQIDMRKAAWLREDDEDEITRSS